MLLVHEDIENMYKLIDKLDQKRDKIIDDIKMFEMQVEDLSIWIEDMVAKIKCVKDIKGWENI